MSTSSRVLVHATSVALGTAGEKFGARPDAGVLLIGKTGSGKSDVALRLIALGAKLISDDQTALFVEDGKPFAEAPSSLYGLMEVRGLGVLRIHPAAASPVVLVIRLDADSAVPRMPEPCSWDLPPGLEPCEAPPLISLNPFEISTPLKIAAAAGAIARGTVLAGFFEPEHGSFL